MLHIYRFWNAVKLGYRRQFSFLARKFSPSVFDTIAKLILESMPAGSTSVRILDCGAGSAVYWREIEKKLGNFKLAITLIDLVRPRELPRLERGSVNFLESRLPEGLAKVGYDDYDIVVALDLIEHLPKSDGYLLLYEMERVAKIAAIIFTPNGLVWQPPSENNPFNAHISGWTPKDLVRFGWGGTMGHGGLKFLTGPYGLPTNHSTPALRAPLEIVGLFVARFPSMCFSFSAVVRSEASRASMNHEGVRGLEG
jgi:hypothetical protein